MTEEDRIREIFAEQLKIDETELTRDLDLADLDVDSLDLLQLMVAIEEEFDISLDEEELLQLETLGSMTDIILERIKE